MKHFNRLIAIGLAVMTSMSTMSLSAFAEQVTPLPGGGEFVIYEEGDEIPQRAITRTADFNFEQTFPKYPSSATLITPYTYNGVNNVVLLSVSERNIMFHFDTAPDGCYIWVYNVNEDRYDLSGATMGNQSSTDFALRNVPAGNAYRFRFSGTSTSPVTLSGSCETY